MQQEVNKVLGEFKQPGPPVNLLLDAVRDKLDDKMSQDELSETCYRWSYHYALKDMEYVPVPLKPGFYLIFLQKPDKVRKKIWEEDTKLKERIRRYLSEAEGIARSNESNYMWLKEMVKFFDKKEETIKVEALQRIIGGHNVEIDPV